MPGKKLPSVIFKITSKAKDKIEGIRFSTVTRRGGVLRRSTKKSTKKADVYRIRMPPGTHPFLISARFFLDESDFVLFEEGVVRVKEFELEWKKKPKFKPYEKLSRKVRGVFERSADKAGADSEEKYYKKIGPVSKAAALNILAKMLHTPVIKHHKVIDYIDHIYRFRPDRFYAKLVDDKSLFADIRLSREKKRKPIFTPASSALHKGFDAASYKTREKDLMGNLQISFSSKSTKDVKIDADIDIFSEVLFHVFGEVFYNSMTGFTTSPFKVYKILAKDKVRPEYTLTS